MARIRTIKPAFYKSDDVVSLSYRARLTWIGLWLYGDDWGRCIDDARLIKGDLWLLEDDITVQIVNELLDELELQGRIRRYTVDGKKYFEIVNFSKHQVVNNKSRVGFPAPEWSKEGSSTEELPESYRTPTGPLSTEGEGEREVDTGRGRPTSRYCLKHPNGTDENCRACGDARRSFDAAGLAAKNRPTNRPPTSSELASGMCSEPGHENYPMESVGPFKGSCTACARAAVIAQGVAS